MDDTEERLRKLEKLVAVLGEIVIDQGEEIERLREELRDARLDHSTDMKLSRQAGRNPCDLR